MHGYFPLFLPDYGQPRGRCLTESGSWHCSLPLVDMMRCSLCRLTQLCQLIAVMLVPCTEQRDSVEAACLNPLAFDMFKTCVEHLRDGQVPHRPALVGNGLTRILACGCCADNPIGDEGVTAVADALATGNTELLSMGLVGVGCGDAGTNTADFAVIPPRIPARRSKSDLSIGFVSKVAAVDRRCRDGQGLGDRRDAAGRARAGR